MNAILFLIVASSPYPRIEGQLEGISKNEVASVYRDMDSIFSRLVICPEQRYRVVFIRDITAWKLNQLFPNPLGIVIGNYNRPSRTIWIATDAGDKVCTLFHEFVHFKFHTCGLSGIMSNDEEHQIIRQMELVYNPSCAAEDGS